MKFTLDITCEGAAFDEDFPGVEVSRILEKVAKRIYAESGPGHTYPLMDFNGNTVGVARFEEEGA